MYIEREKKRMKKITIIVPCYNEEETIPYFYNEIVKYLDSNHDWHIILVNDGSKDKTLEIMKEYAKKDKRMLYLSFSRNFGKEAAMYAGLEASMKIKSDAAIIMDVDLQDPPSLIPEMLKAYEEGYQHIYAKHKNRKGANPFKAMCSLAFYKVYAFITKDKQMAKGARDFCLLDKKVVEAFLKIKDYERFTKGIYHYVGFKKKCIEFDYVERVAGTTKWSFKKLFHYALLGIREFSRFYEYIPKIFAWLTFFLLGFDVIYGIVKHNMNWSAIRLDAFMLLLFITLFYICRLIYEVRNQVQNRPIYIEDESNMDEVNEAE